MSTDEDDDTIEIQVFDLGDEDYSSMMVDPADYILGSLRQEENEYPKYFEMNGNSYKLSPEVSELIYLFHHELKSLFIRRHIGFFTRRLRRLIRALLPLNQP